MKRSFLILFCVFCSTLLFAQGKGGATNDVIVRTGNLGIAVTNPQAKLDVLGNAILKGNITSQKNDYFAEAFGDSALFTLTNASGATGVTGIGHGAGKNSQTALWSTYVGFMSGYMNVSGAYNTFMGTKAGLQNTSSGNTFIGNQAGELSITGNANTFIGNGTGRNNNDTSNVMIGNTAGYNNNGKANVFLGNNTGFNNNGSRNIFIGNQAGLNEAGSDKLYIENSNSATPLIYGDFSTNYIKINGGLQLQNATQVDTIETSLTNSATNIPTSSAVFSELAGKASIADSGMFAVNGTDIYNKNSGGVGIGTTAPNLYEFGNLLMLHGDKYVPSYPDSSIGFTNDAQIRMGYPLLSSKVWSGYSTLLQMTAKSTNTLPHIYMRNSDNTMGFDIVPSNTGTVYLYNRYDNDAANFRFVSKGDNVTKDVFTITGGGNIGIGITNPVHPLSVVGNSYFNGNVGIGYTNATNGLAVSGNIGIGTTNPIYPLQSIQGTSSLVINSSNFLGLGNATMNPVNRFQIEFDKDAIPDSNLSLTTAGKIGLGTTNPLAKIHIANPTGVSGSIIIGYRENGFPSFSQGVSGLKLYSYTTTTTNKYTPFLEFGSFDGTFTTVNPRTLAWIAARATQTYSADTTTGTAIDFATTANNAGATATPTVRMTIGQSGNMGIGITNPIYKLQVTGGYAMADSLIIPNTKPKAPVAGAMRWSNDTLYFYNGSAWKWAVFN